MKTRDSGMPEEALWASFFDPESILDRLGLQNLAGDAVEFGCGYGTFTLPAAKRTTGTVYALEIEPDLAALVEAKAAALPNVRVRRRDFVVEGTGLADESAEYVMLFNILHAEEAPAMLAEARRVLRPAGMLGVIHWNYDERTPRGPSMDIRQRPEECRNLALSAGFELLPPGIMELPPYHYGMVLRRPATGD